MFFLSVTYIFAQNVNDQKYRLAESYENAGDYASASRIYLELYNSNPQSDQYFNGVVRVFKAQNKFSGLVEIIEKRLESFKSSENYSLLGEMLWKTGSFDSANTAWDNAIKYSPQIVNSYSEVAHSQISLQLFDKAIKTLVQGRKALKNDNIFSDELSQLYISTGDYALGTQEVLKLFAFQKNLPFAQGRLSALMVSKDANVHINKILQDEVSSNSSDIQYLRLYAWFLRAMKNPEKALEIYQKIDDLTGGIGLELYRYASDCRVDGEYDMALKAFELVIAKEKASPYFLSALYGFARTMESKSQVQSKFTQDELDNIIKRYKQIISDYPNEMTAGEARYRIAVLALEQMNDRDMAIDELNQVIKQFPYNELAANSSLLLASIKTMQDKLDEAYKIYDNVVKTYSRYAAQEAEKATYKMAEIEYFRGNIDSSMTLFTKISVNTSSDVANDALNKILLIEQNKQYTKALPIYAKAELRELQGKPDEANDLFKQVSETTEGTDIAERSIINSAKIFFKKSDYINAMKLLQSLLEKNPETIYGDKICLFIGDIYTAEKNIDSALKIYTELITKYPRSIYLQEAREKIIKLRAMNKT
ncbi:MAG: tetratricopeptide repeat protein [FCB group bacterium]